MSALLETLITNRNKAWDAAKSYNDIPDAERSIEHDTSFDQAMADVDAIDARIKSVTDAEERSANLVRSAEKYATTGAPPAPASGEAQRLMAFLNGETRSFDAQAPERRDLLKGAIATGGATVPTGFYNTLVKHLTDNNLVMAAGATILNTTMGETIMVPTTTAISSFSDVAEGAAIPESDPVYAQRSLGAFKKGVMIQLSTELLTDSAFDMAGEMARQAGIGLANKLGTEYLIGLGSGSNQATGITTSTTLGVTGGVGAAPTFDNLIDMQHSVISAYRTNGVWVMRDATVAAVRKIKDTTGQYIWQAATQLGAPDVLLGKPIYSDPAMPAFATAAKSVIFGDLSKYIIRLAGGVRVERSDEFAFNQDLVTLRVLVRHDGLLIDQTGAVKHYTSA
jgi:HK97 family phage major capsid protein